MDLAELEAEFAALPNPCKTADVDRLNRRLIRCGADVSFLHDIILENRQYHRTYFQVSLAKCRGIEAKLDFIEANLDKLDDWWHVDQLPQFLGGELTFDAAYPRAVEYVKSELPFARRWGYVMFMPTLTRCSGAVERITTLLADDDAYYVQMAEAWLLSDLAVYAPRETFDYLAGCTLDYAIVGKAIQKICDSFRIGDEWKERFKALRARYRR